MTALVVDASVVIKWFVPEIHTEAARRWLDVGRGFVAPDLLFAETANTIWKKVRRVELTRDQGHQIIADLVDVAIDAVPSRALMEDALAIATRTDRCVYDALYLALAVRLDTRLITADEGLVTGVASFRALAPHIVHVTSAA